MNVHVFVKIGRKQGLLGWDGELLIVGVDAPPIDGGANKRLIEILSTGLGTSRSSVKIVKGHSSRYKTLEVDIPITSFNDIVNLLPRIPKQEKLF